MAVREERLNIVTSFNAQGIERYSSQVGRAGKETNALSGIVTKAAAALAALFTIRAGAGLLKHLANTAAQFESTALSIEVFVGSAERAAQVVQDALDFAITTPFEQDEIIAATKTLLAFGSQAEDIGRLLKILGEAAAASGTSIQNLAFVFGQVRAQGKAQLQDLYQFVNAGIPIFELLADSIGVNVSEIRKLTSAGKITAQVLDDAFTKAAVEGGRFNGALLRQSQTLSGITSNLKDEIANIVREISLALLPQFKALAQGALEFVRTLDVERIKDFVLGFIAFVREAGPLIATLARATAGYLAYKTILGIATVAQKLFNTTVKANPIGLLIGGIAALIPALLKLNREYSSQSKALKEIKGLVAEVNKEFLKEAQSADKLFNVLTDLNATQKERQDALDELNELYPEVIAKYDLEKGRLEDIASAQDEVNKKIGEAIKARQTEQIVAEGAQEILRLQLKKLEGPSLLEQFSLGQLRGGGSIEERFERAINAQIARVKEGVKQAQEELNNIDFSSLFVDTPEATGRAFGSQFRLTQEKQNAAIAEGIRLRKELSKLTTDELRAQLSLADISEIQKKTITEILAERKKVTAATTDEIAAARGSLAALQEQLKNLEERISKAAPGSGLLESLSRQANTVERQIESLKFRIDFLRESLVKPLPTGFKNIDEALKAGVKIIEEQFERRQQTLTDITERANKDRQDRIVRLERESNLERGKEELEARETLLKQLTDLDVKELDKRELAFQKFEDEILLIQRRRIVQQIEILEQQPGTAEDILNLQNQIADIDLTLNENAVQRLRDQLDFSDIVEAGILPVIDGIAQITQALEEAADRAYEIQQRRVDDARKLAEKGNAELLQLEEDRLTKSEERRRRAAQTTREIAAIEFAANSAVAIARAAATTGPLALALIPAIIAAIAGGIAQARALAQGFEKGTEYVEGEPGRDKIPARLTKGERIVDAPTNAQLDGIPNESLPDAVKYYTREGKELVKRITFLEQSYLTKIKKTETTVQTLEKKLQVVDKTLPIIADLPDAVNMYYAFTSLPVVKESAAPDKDSQSFKSLERQMQKMNDSLNNMRMILQVDEFGLYAGLQGTERKVKRKGQLFE